LQDCDKDKNAQDEKEFRVHHFTCRSHLKLPLCCSVRRTSLIFA